jgi:putative oxidoreductase
VRAERAGVDTALLLARIALGLPFLYHGAAIAFGAFGGPGLKGFSGFTHMPLPVAALVGYGEFLGGLGVLLGVLSRLASAGLGLIMLGAIFLVHLPHGYDSQKQGFEYPLTLLLLAVAILAAGPGRLTLARALPLPKKPGTDQPVTALE